MDDRLSKLAFNVENIVNDIIDLKQHVVEFRENINYLIQIVDNDITGFHADGLVVNGNVNGNVNVYGTLDTTNVDKNGTIITDKLFATSLKILDANSSQDVKQLGYNLTTGEISYI